MMTAADKQALWDAYLAASANQDRADARLLKAMHEAQQAAEHAKNCERYADDAYEAWSNA